MIYFLQAFEFYCLQGEIKKISTCHVKQAVIFEVSIGGMQDLSN